MARGKRSGFSFNGSLTAVLQKGKYGVRYKNVFQRFMRNKQLQPYFHAIEHEATVAGSFIHILVLIFFPTIKGQF